MYIIETEREGEQGSPQEDFKGCREGNFLYDQASTSKLIDPPLYHIKGKSVMKACWADMPCNCWGEHWRVSYSSTPQHSKP